MPSRCSAGATVRASSSRSAKGVKLIDMDGKEYYDLTSGMMCMVLGHSHPELTETIKEMAGTFVHQSSWYSNPWTVEFAERLGETHAREPQGRELRRDGVGGQRDRDAHGARLYGQVRHRLDDPRASWRQPRGRGIDQRRRQPQARALGRCMFQAKSNCAVAAATATAAPSTCKYPCCDIACLKSSEEMLEFVTSQEVAAIMVETIPVPVA